MFFRTCQQCCDHDHDGGGKGDDDGDDFAAQVHGYFSLRRLQVPGVWFTPVLVGSRLLSELAALLRQEVSMKYQPLPFQLPIE